MALSDIQKHYNIVAIIPPIYPNHNPNPNPNPTKDYLLYQIFASDL